MAPKRFAIPAPSSYRYAVHSCAFKLDLDVFPDHALALFADEGMARRYGAWMWPSTYEIVDLLARKEGDS